MRQGPGVGAQRPDPYYDRVGGLIHGGSKSTSRGLGLGRAVACSISGFAVTEAEFILHMVLTFLRSQRLVFAVSKSIEIHGSTTRVREYVLTCI